MASQSALALVQSINSRFAHGRPSNVVAEAGVLVHVFDHEECWQPEDLPWALRNDTLTCSKLDHLSTSLINARAGDLFLGLIGGVGMIMSPSSRVLCSYPFDGDTEKVPRGGCGGSACAHGLGGRVQGPNEDPSWQRCTWPPDRLREMLEIYAARLSVRAGRRGLGGGMPRYNEVIVGKGHWRRHLPQHVEAIVFFGRHEERARRIHRAFLARYGSRVAHTPLLRLRGTGRGGGAGAFVDVTETPSGVNDLGGTGTGMKTCCL